MSSRDFDSIQNTFSTGIIITIVVSSVFGLAFCIGVIIVIVCLIKYFNRPRSINNMHRIAQPIYPYPHSWSTVYPPNVTSVSNYPSAPPPYSADVTELNKMRY